MSKSLGNFFTIREIFEKSQYSESVTAECLRYLFLSTHYRSDLSFSDKAIEESKSALDSIYGLIQRLEEANAQKKTPGDKDCGGISKDFANKFHESMDDDCNTPKVLGAFHELRGEVNKLLVKGLSEKAREKTKEGFLRFGEPLGLFQIPSNIWFKQGLSPSGIQSAEAVGTPGVKMFPPLDESKLIEKQINLRNEARAKKDFAIADTIRKELANQGIILEDRPDGTTRWKR